MGVTDTTFDRNIARFSGAVESIGSLTAVRAGFCGNQGDYVGAVTVSAQSTLTNVRFADNNSSLGSFADGLHASTAEDVDIAHATFVGHDGTAVHAISGDVTESLFADNGIGVSAGRVDWSAIPEAITPMNRILVGVRRG